MSDKDEMNSVYDSNIPPETLRAWAKDDNEELREAVAQNPNTPVDVLVELSVDPYWGVRYDVASNPNTPIEVLRVLAKDDSDVGNGGFDVREAVAANPNTPPEILEAIENQATLYEHQSNGLSGTQNVRETMLSTKEKAEIIFEFINEYKMDGVFDDFFSYNDLGVPMAVMIVNDLIILTDEGLDVINETWKSLCEQLNDADPHYEYADLKDLVERNVPFEDPNEPEGIEG